ncbi:MAG: endonuclease MutS2, partial [Treponemataceae bacterium]|nr:endonuclease MutS2 [Treponemataceae bacterium]
ILHSFTANPRFADVLESTVPVLRAGRQPLAVKSSRRSSIPGIIHELSQTGMTVYIEPEESVRCSNELVQAEFDYSQEVRKILAALSAELRPSAADLSAALSIMEGLDAALAAAAWGAARNAVFAADCAESGEPPALVQARHPLLGERAVPIDVAFPRGTRVLIVTGPNTGGKTVALKTIALFALLNQSGFPVPAAEGTRLPLFTDIFADIGDSQSIEQSLSTFGGHMKNIAAAVRGADGRSLVLLDELGSGTDPQEGSAVAMAVLDELIARKSFVLITTHHGALKNYGYTRPECANASVEFNQDTLRPTYRLLMGVPGESHALDIAEGSGLPGSIIAAARAYIATEQADVSALITGLSQKHRELDEQADALEKRRLDLDEQIRRTDER